VIKIEDGEEGLLFLVMLLSVPAAWAIMTDDYYGSWGNAIAWGWTVFAVMAVFFRFDKLIERFERWLERERH